MRSVVAALAAVLSLEASLFASPPPPPMPPAPPSPTPAAPIIDSKVAVESSNAFACDMFRKLGDVTPDQNVLFSPYSISSVLAMALEGARNETALEMGKTLRLPPSLSQPSTAQPWRTAPYAEGFGTVADRLQAAVDPARAAAKRKQIDEWRAELAELNRTIQSAQIQRVSDDLIAKQQRAASLAQWINGLAKEIEPFDLRVANVLYGDRSHPFDVGYVRSVDRQFGAGRIALADFRNNYPSERAGINRWVEMQTNGRIKDLLPTLRAEEARLLRLVLINAIYFKGQWSEPFEERSTIDGDFRLAAGDKVKAKLMSQTAHLACYGAFNGDGSAFRTPFEVPANGDTVATYPDDRGFLVAELPMRGNRISLVFLAPRKADGLPDLERKLTGGSAATWLRQLQQREMYVTLPRFKLETEYNVADVLQNMGMRSAFLQDADFSGMTASLDPNHRLFLSRVIHKAFVEVNEKGAEAAAASAVMMALPTSPAPVPQIMRPFVPEFRADRPFLFLIRDSDSGMILFMGRVTRPAP